MTVRRIGDTNVWYNIGDGSLTVADIVSVGEQLYYPLTTVLEILGKVNASNFEQRRAACQAIVISGAACLDPEAELAAAFGYPVTPDIKQWTEAVAEMAKCQMYDAEKSEAYYTMMDGRRHRVLIPVAAEWRQGVESRWMDILSKYLSLPGCNPTLIKWLEASSDKRSERRPKLTSKQEQLFLQHAKTPQMLEAIYTALWDRLVDSLYCPNPLPSESDVHQALSKGRTALTCFCACYHQFMIKIVTEGRKFEENDRLDVENFVLAQDDNSIVVTSDKKWVCIAERAGYKQRAKRV